MVSGGTDNHLMLINLGGDGISGKKAEERLGKAGITVNKNTVPFDTRKPYIGSGVRIGTPAVTTRGMGTDEMTAIAGSSTASCAARTRRCGPGQARGRGAGEGVPAVRRLSQRRPAVARPSQVPQLGRCQ